MPYIPLTESDQQEMLKAVGISSIEELFSDIPEEYRLKKSLDLPEAMSEWLLQRHMGNLAEKNAGCLKMPCFMGAGAYQHVIPAVVSALASRSEFLTAYTPYQPEISQGTLQAQFEFQTMMTQLTGMPVSNASLYDGAMACAEAGLLALRVSRKKTLAVSRGLTPGYRKTLETYCRYQNTKIIELPIKPDGQTDLSGLNSDVIKDIGGLIIQSPNFFGVVEDLKTAGQMMNSQPGLFVVAVSEALSLAGLIPPGQFDADIVCGEAHSLGLAVSYGGPFLGFFTVKEKYLRQMPGRVIGMTLDKDDRIGFVNTLSTREQHIRREKATSNICTNQALCALTCGIFMASLGRKGLMDLARLNMKKTAYLKQRISEISGYKFVFSGPVFNEFLVKVPGSASEVNRHLLGHGFIGGYDVGMDFPEYQNSLLFCSTERNTKEDIDRFVNVLDQFGRAHQS